MKRFEYRVEQLPTYEHYEVHTKELLKRLTELGNGDGRSRASTLLGIPPTPRRQRDTRRCPCF